MSEQKKSNGGCLSVVIIVAVLIFVVAFHFSPPKVAATNTVDRGDACFMAQKFVKNRLKAPSTAEFPLWTEDNCKVSNTGGKWIVYSFVDAENGFGAMLRNDYVAEMTYNKAGDVWTLTNLTMEGR